MAPSKQIHIADIKTTLLEIIPLMLNLDGMQTDTAKCDMCAK